MKQKVYGESQISQAEEPPKNWAHENNILPADGNFVIETPMQETFEQTSM